MSLADSIIDYEKYKYEHFSSLPQYTTNDELKFISKMADRGRRDVLVTMLAYVDRRHYDKGVDVGQVRLALTKAVAR